MNRSLVDLLREGGYILYSRHGEATVGVDQPNLNFWYCFTQRNLSEEGRKQAIYYGEILRDLQIPISYPIITSPFCRTIKTAQLAFGKANIKIDPFLFEIYKLSKSSSSTEQKIILDFLRSMLEIEPPHGNNRVIIAHGFSRDIGLGEIPNMGTVIIKPLGQGNGYEIVDKLSLEDLGNLLS
ncbi:histidine phosphatase family protein [Tepidibacter aestuarii]|uniref:histidine phosphatase family protein n=1 Tax=Tepidibacter aestuarii TaxID=2925782 RepID=UPI0020BE9F1B|nr:histidine phosphatase family protein [Tepidibacter aestuarii]CAH2213426.1 Histidine phosphatase family protein [Tepidibacter aestuarii]